MPDTKSRKYLLTINNPQKYGYSVEIIKDILKSIAVVYYCLSLEIGEEGTKHMHIFFYVPTTIRFSTVKRKFEFAHIETARGTCKQNRDYIQKEGKWIDSPKANTSIEGTFIEWGEMPDEGREKSPQNVELLEMIDKGMSIREILKKHPEHANKTRMLEHLEQSYYADFYRTTIRQVNVTYIYDIDDSFDRKNIFLRDERICRITNYRTDKGISFDVYNNQPVIVFDNFIGQVRILEMITYLEGYPLCLPARYGDRTACYTEVIIISSLPINNIYKGNSTKLINKFYKKIDEYHICMNGILEHADLKNEEEYERD